MIKNARTQTPLMRKEKDNDFVKTILFYLYQARLGLVVKI